MAAIESPSSVPTATIEVLRRKLVEPKTTLAQKYRVLFSLRNVPGKIAHDAIMDGLSDPSDLFRHEVAYVLGQRQEPEGVATLARVLSDPSDHPMVRHEAGEALGAIATPECLEPLQAHAEDPCLEVAQTCQLALQRVAHYRSRVAEARGVANDADDEASPASTADLPPGEPADGTNGDDEPESKRYSSVDPAPAMARSTPVGLLRSTLLDEDAPIFERYRAMFALRDLGGRAAVEALSASFRSPSALLKHEVAYVLGQMQDADAVDELARVLRDQAEAAMVRHEAAEALGAIADERALDLLREHCSDPEPIVADSCVVALDVLEFERSGGFQYADMGDQEVGNTAAQVA